MIAAPTRILCPVDFSGPATKALAYAAALARWHHAEVTVLHVHQMQISPLLAVGPYVGPTTPVVLSDVERAQLEAALTQLTTSDTMRDVTVTTTLIEDVSVPAAILAQVEAMHSDLVVMGTEGHSGIERLMLGSVAERVLRKATCPVLTVPPNANRGLSPDSIREVFCPIDFSRSSAAALEWATAWAAKARARLTALHVIEMPPEASDPPLAEYAALRDRLIRNAHETMKTAVPDRIRLSGTFDEQLAVGRPGTDILRLAEARPADLIVMGVRGRGAMDLAVFGSVTHQVVRRAGCPVLAVHPQPERASSAARP
jgi:nucleotide-binding universal stress UspA family protein